MIQQMLAISSLVPLPFLNTAWTSRSSQFTYYWRLTWRILSITFLSCERVQLCNSLNIFLPFFGIGMKTDLCQPCGHCWFFQICWHIECGTLTAYYFMIWNSSTGVPSPQLALFVVMLPKVYLTSNFRISGSRWVITPLWLSESLRYFLFSSSVYFWNLFLISSASVRSI